MWSSRTATGPILSTPPEGEAQASRNSPVARRTITRLLQQRVFFNLLFLLLILGGIYALFTSPVENMPSVDSG